MAKILISSIGTGQKRDGGYRVAKYKYQEETKETPFISKALCEFLNIDKLYLVGTTGSIWDSVYKEFGGTNEEIELSLYEKQEENSIRYSDLEIVNKQINNYLKSNFSNTFLINYGINEEELWKNFEIYLKILDNINENDEVYIDISHSFRSLALFSFIMAQFGQTIREKDFKISGIFYGMLEYNSQNDGITPIIDLKILFELIEWMKAIDNFVKYGNSDTLSKLLKDGDESNFFNSFALALQVGNLESIRNNVKKANKYIKLFENSSNPILNLLTPKLIEFIEALSKDKESDFQLAVAQWFLEHKNYALSYMALVESIVTKVCELQGYDIKDKDRREYAKREISLINKKLYYNIYREANEVRRDIAYQLGKRSNNILIDVKRLKNFIDNTNDIFKSL